MPLKSFTLNGIPIEDRGFTLSNARGWLSVPPREFQRAPLLFRDGERVLGVTARTSARMLGLDLLGRRLTMTQRDTILSTALREWSGLIEVVALDAPTKACYGLLESNDAIVPTPAFVAGSVQQAVKPALIIRCDDPLKYDLLPSSVSIPTINTPVALPIDLATAKMRKLKLILNGSFSSPITAILKNVGGDELMRMAIATAAGATEYLEVDCDAFTVTKWAAGVGTDVTSTLDISHTFFEIDPQDTPTLQIDKGTGAAHLVRAYLS